MPNSVGPNGVTVKTQDELIADKTAAYQAAYGADIDLSSSSPDGNRMMSEVQAIMDQQDLALQVNAQFDPDQAQGRILDQRAAINGVERQEGTFTLTFLTLTLDRATTLAGLDENINEADGTGYTTSDDAGNNWVLAATTVIAAPGTYELLFRAQSQGAVGTTPNTITNQVTIVLGVTSVNNPTTYETLGIDEEPDTKFRIRRQKSVSIGGTGFPDNLESALANVRGVMTAIVHENDDDAADGDGTPGHTIWVIVNGGAPSDIAAAIFSKRSGGCGTRGAQSYTVTRRNGTPYIVRWDAVEAEDLYLKFTITSIDGETAVDSAAIAAALVPLLSPEVYEEVDVGTLTALVRQIDPNCLVVPTVGDGLGTSGAGPFSNILLPTAKNKQFVVSAAHMAITVV